MFLSQIGGQKELFNYLLRKRSLQMESRKVLFDSICFVDVNFMLKLFVNPLDVVTCSLEFRQHDFIIDNVNVQYIFKCFKYSLTLRKVQCSLLLHCIEIQSD